MRNRILFAHAAAIAIASTSAAARAGEPRDIVDTAIAAGNFKTLVTAVKAAGLVDALKGKGPFTVFAPTDEAFGRLPKGTLENLLRPENREQLAGILTYHVVPAKLMARDVLSSDGAVTLNGQKIDFARKDKSVTIDGATVSATDIACTNGVIHVIDAVILPESKNLVEVAGAARTFQTLLTAATKAGLADVLAKEGPFTLFAPTDEAFARLGQETINDLLKPENKAKLAAILKYHVVPGRVYAKEALSSGKATTLQGQGVVIKTDKTDARVNNAKILKTDVDAANGVVHVIDTVILPK